MQTTSKSGNTWSYSSTIGVTGVPYTTDGYHYNRPSGVVVDGQGSIYLTEENGHRLIKLNNNGSLVWIIGVAGLKEDWNLSNAVLDNPADIALDSIGKIYVADRWHERVQVFNSDGTYLGTIGNLSCPGGVGIAPNNYLYIANTCNHTVLIYNTNFQLVSTLGVSGVAGSDNAHFNNPEDAVIDSTGKIYVSDSFNHRVQVFNSNGTYIRTMGATGVSSNDNNHFNQPENIFLDNIDRLYVVDRQNNRIQIFSSTGSYLATIGGVFGNQNGQFDNPMSVAIDLSGNIYITDSGNHRIQKYSPPLDRDGDGLLDSWEEKGFDFNNDGKVDVDLPKMGADPDIPDIFVEVDYMVDYGNCWGSICLSPGHTHKPKPDAIALVVDAFARKGIHLHVDYGPDASLTWGTSATWGPLSHAEALPDQEVLWPRDLDWNNAAVDIVKNQQGHFSPERSAIFHYAIFAHFLGSKSYSESTSGVSLNISGLCSDIHKGARDFVVSLGAWPGNGDDVLQAATFMHELGHNLGLCDGGGDGELFKPNYFSVMNYSFQKKGLIYKEQVGTIDYSNFGSNPSLVETDLDENIGVNGGDEINDYGTYWYCKLPNAIYGLYPYTLHVRTPIDWNCNNNKTEIHVVANINDGYQDNPVHSDPYLTILRDYNDWPNIVFNGVDVLGVSTFRNDSFDKADTTVFPSQGLTYEIAQKIVSPYEISISGSSHLIVSPGIISSYMFSTKNSGENLATINFTSATSSWLDVSNIPEQIILSPGSSYDYTVFFTIPVNATVGEIQKMNLKGVVQESPLIKDSAELIIEVGPKAWFEARPAKGTAPHLVSFTDCSQGNVVSRLWTFGDGATSTEVNPSHLYSSSGSYTVSLTVHALAGSSSFSKQILVSGSHLYLPIIRK